ncbi:MAG: hypothetical protein HKM04_00215 [Legionellales bacterium]|nr:hypothetical protein [Legionellales bacterium]
MQDPQSQFLELVRDEIKNLINSLMEEDQQEEHGLLVPLAVDMREIPPLENSKTKPITEELKPAKAQFQAYREELRKRVFEFLHRKEQNLYALGKHPILNIDTKGYFFRIKEYEMLLNSQKFSRWLDETINYSINRTLLRQQADAAGILRLMLLERILESDDIANRSSDKLHQLILIRFDVTSELRNSLPDYLKALLECPPKLGPEAIASYLPRLQKAHGFMASLGIHDFTLSPAFVLTTVDADAKGQLRSYPRPKIKSLDESQKITDYHLLRYIDALRNGRVKNEKKPLPIADDIENSASENLPPAEGVIKKTRSPISPILDLFRFRGGRNNALSDSAEIARNAVRDAIPKATRKWERSHSIELNQFGSDSDSSAVDRTFNPYKPG